MAVRSDPGKKKPPTLWTVTTARWVIQRAYPIIATRLLFSIVLKPMSEQAVYAFMNELQLFGMGFSWGGFESLVIPFNCASYRTATTWNPGGPALRFQVGLEDMNDLTADLDKGFERLRANA